MNFNFELIKPFLVSAGIFILFIILQKIFIKYILRLLTKLTVKTSTDIDEKILTSFERPLRYLFIILGLYLAILQLPYISANNATISNLFRSAVIILITWGFYNLEDPHSGIFEGLNKKYSWQFDDILIPFLSRILRVITILLAVSIIAQEWDYKVDSFIAGLGLGGLAFALAAQDTIANIFGGIIIIVDRPFSIGDWIKAQDIEGTVEDITFRSTRIRTFAQALVTVPNSSLANGPITNWSRRGKRRITFNLGVTYSTSKEQLKNCVTKIKLMLQEHPDVNKDTIFVTFDKYNDSSLDIFLYFFADTANWEKYLLIKEDINYRIMEILEEEDVSVAFPSTTVYLEKDTEQVKSFGM